MACNCKQVASSLFINHSPWLPGPDSDRMHKVLWNGAATSRTFCYRVPVLPPAAAVAYLATGIWFGFFLSRVNFFFPCKPRLAPRLSSLVGPEASTRVFPLHSLLCTHDCRTWLASHCLRAPTTPTTISINHACENEHNTTPRLSYIRT